MVHTTHIINVNRDILTCDSPTDILSDDHSFLQRLINQLSTNEYFKLHEAQSLLSLTLNDLYIHFKHDIYFRAPVVELQALIYLERMQKKGFIVTSHNIHILAGTLLFQSYKYLSDHLYIKNSDYAQLMKIHPKTINAYEDTLLDTLEWNLFVSRNEYKKKAQDYFPNNPNAQNYFLAPLKKDSAYFPTESPDTLEFRDSQNGDASSPYIPATPPISAFGESSPLTPYLRDPSPEITGNKRKLPQS